MGMVFQWRPGALPPPVDAQVAGHALNELRERAGSVTPAAVVEAARPAESPLHPAFEWDDRAAAESWRREQAGYMLRHLVVDVSAEGVNEPKFIRAFVSITENKQPQYVDTMSAMGDAEIRQKILRRAWHDLQAWERRYREYEELAEVMIGIERARLRAEPVTTAQPAAA